MIGCYDFCGHYEWTFGWFERTGGHALVRAYWHEAINLDSQAHARDLIKAEGFAGMLKYWGHTLTEESPELGFTITPGKDVFRIDFHQCPSRGFLLRNDLKQYRDYCDHCMGWIGPMMQKAGFVVDHEHNHRGQCWWEMRQKSDPMPPSIAGTLSGENDVRLLPGWKSDVADTIDHYERATDPDDKTTVS